MEIRVLVVTDLGTEWKSGHLMIKALRDVGVTTLGVDPLLSDKSLLLVTEEFQPHLILLTKGKGISLETISLLKKKGARFAMWYPDYLISESILSIARNMDYFFTTYEGMISYFKEHEIPNVFYLPQGFEPSFFKTDYITEEDRKSYGSDITFIGTLEPTELYRFRSKWLDRVIEEGYQLRWWGPTLSRKLRNIKLMLSPLGRSYGGKPVYLTEFAKVIKTSKIFLAFDVAPHIKKSLSVRIYMALGCGAFYMCRYVEGIEEIFKPGEDIITFTTAEEMIDKIRYYLPRESLRKEIALRGQEKVLKEHSYEIRMRQFLNILLVK